MKNKSALCVVFSVVILSASAAWAAETPKPGKTKEETMRNKAELKCKTEYPVIVEAMVDGYAGKTAQQIKSRLRQAFDKDEAAGTYYTKLNDRDPWIEKMGNTALEVGQNIKKSDPGASIQKVRAELIKRAGPYLDQCTENTYKALMD